MRCMGKYTDMLFVEHSSQSSASVCPCTRQTQEQDQSSGSADLTTLFVIITASVVRVLQPQSSQTKGINQLSCSRLSTSSQQNQSNPSSFTRTPIISYG